MSKQVIEASRESLEGNDLSDEEFEEIKDEYLDTIEIPGQKPDKQILVCPIGLVGAGKTTVIKKLSKELSLVRISTDEVRKLLREAEFNYARTQEMAYKIISQFISQGHSIGVDADCIAEAPQKFIRRAEQEMGMHVVWIHINPPEEWILDNLKHHTWFFRDGEQALANYLRRKPLHENINLPFTYVFDTSQDNLNEQIQEAVEKIRSVV